MGSSGHAFIAHTKALSPAAQAKDGGYGPPPHPGQVRAGQRYWPRAGHRRAVLTVKRVDGARAVLAHPDRGHPSVRVSVDRLLAVRPDGQGRHYQFHGFAPRRYATYAYVSAVQDGHAVLCVPEWHPRRAVHLPVRLLPADSRHSGAWLNARCDLSASSAARLQVADLAIGPPPAMGAIAAPSLDVMVIARSD